MGVAIEVTNKLINSTKIKSLHIENLNNVKNGSVDFSFDIGGTLDAINEKVILNMVGVCGENGSGKTTLMQSLSIMKSLILGESLTSRQINLLHENKFTILSITVLFNETEEITYTVKLRKFKTIENDLTVQLISECIEFSGIDGDVNDSNTFGYDFSNDFLNKVIDENNSFEKNSVNNINFVKRNDLLQEKCILFNEKFLNEWIKTDSQKKLYKNLFYAINLMKNNFCENLIIFSDEMLFENQFIPIRLSSNTIYFDEGLFKCHHYEVQTRNEFDDLCYLFDRMNEILSHMIPNFKIVCHKGEHTYNDPYFISVYFDNGMSKLRYDELSKGIKKIISLVPSIMYLFNNKNAIMVIDDLDINISEFLIGTIVQFLSESIEGQILFTFNNLRILEVLPQEKIIFITTNPSNRYINLKKSNKIFNLRDEYIRRIQIGGWEEGIFLNITIWKIRRELKSMK